MSRSDLEDLMWEAWQTVWPKLQSDPDELRARLARRRSKTYLKPMRANCLAVRASDRRINSWDAITIPDDACHLGRPDLYRQHIVSVDKRLLLAVCAPIDVHNWGETAKALASRMGCPKTFVRQLRKSGTLRVRYRMDRTFTYPEPPAGSRKNPAIHHCDSLLDPSAFGKQKPDPIFGPLWAWYAQCLPDDFSQDLTRVPMYQFTKTPGRPQFTGWRWICPGCKKQVRTIYLPQGASDWGRYIGLKVEESEVDAVPEPPPCFACNACHDVTRFSRVDRNCWNNLILHLSGGLLYGREVRKPAWLTPDRKRRYVPHPRKRPRLDKTERLLCETTLTISEIALEMGLTRNSAAVYATKLYKLRRVHSRAELRQRYLRRHKHRKAPPPAPNTPNQGQVVVAT